MKNLTGLKQIIFITLFFAVNIQAQVTIDVKVDEPLADIQPYMWGIFFEDINFAADGGIYAEMVKNRSFEFNHPLMGWSQPNSDRHSLNKESGMATIMKSGSEPNNHFARIDVNNSSGYVLINEGFRAMGIQKDAVYNLSLNALNNGGIKQIQFQFIDKNNKVLGETSIAPDAKEWKKYEASLQATSTDAKAKLKITFDGTGTIDLDMISLFPKDTWLGRPNGLRKDLVQLLADLQPGFLRFPGGCIVEGRTLAKRYQWKKTLGNIEDRQILVNRWNTEFKHRLTPDYFQSFGLGFFEYFQLSEDIGATPLPILSCGMACQFNTAELVPLDELGPYVQDALDLIEFANGPIDSKWGKIRADMGHPEQFNLKMIGVGNEQWGADYFDRLKIFIDAIKSRYPEITIVSGTGPFPDGEHFDYAEEELKKLNAEIVDEHYYRPPQWFLDNADRYDKYDRNSYKIFAGEYAAQSVAIASPENKNNWQCALSEAAFLTGLERNADLVHMTSYAPLFAHVEGWQWTPDLIWFDNLESFGTPNYYVQKLFSTNKGTKLISAQINNEPIKGQQDLYASAVLDETTKEIIIKLVNSSSQAKKVNISLDGSGKLMDEAKLLVLTGKNPNDVNSIEHPKAISPTESKVSVNGKILKLVLQPNSLSVAKITQQ